MSEGPSNSHARRNRMIAIVAGAITVIAIVLAFASEYLELPWKWIRPAAELLLLGELVGLVVLERHQLFEPVHGTVGAIKADSSEILARLAKLTERLDSAGQIEILADARELLRAHTQIAREAFARDQSTPQVLRFARLSGRGLGTERSDLSASAHDWIEAARAFELLPTSPPDSKARRWSVRGIMALDAGEVAKLGWDPLFWRFLNEEAAVNMEVKVLLRSEAGPALAPGLVTDRDALLLLGDEHTVFRWGFLLHGVELHSMVVQWFDDLWASIPNASMVYARSGLNQAALERLKKEAEAIAAAAEQP